MISEKAIERVRTWVTSHIHHCCPSRGEARETVGEMNKVIELLKTKNAASPRPAKKEKHGRFDKATDI